MQVRFATVDTNYIKSLVANGFYTTENEVVRDAVRRMREAEQKSELLKAAILVGDKQIANGEAIPFSDELLNKIEEKAIANAKNNIEVNNPDVLPI